MNKGLFAALIKKKPDKNSKTIYINDNQLLCEQIIGAGGLSVFISRDEENENYFKLQEFIHFLEDHLFGMYVDDFIYIPTCSRKSINDEIIACCKHFNLRFYEDGWKLFKNKDYLSEPEYQEELKRILKGYQDRVVGPNEEDRFKGRFHKFNGNNAATGVIDKEIIDYIIETNQMFVLNGSLYLYKDGVYVEDVKGIEIKNKIQSVLYTSVIKANVISQIYSLLLIQEQLQVEFKDLNAYPETWINFKNGMYDVIEAKLYPHSEAYYSINQIPHNIILDFVPERDWKFTGPFLDTIVSGQDDKQMLLQYIGYCMTRDTGQQKFMIIKGNGGTGKSRIIRLVEEIIGHNNYSNISLQDLNKRFYATNLYCRLLNSCADIASDAMESVDVIKKATGEDALMYEKKGQDPITFRSYAKLLFSANKIPLNLDEKSNAYYRRLLIFEMNKKPEKKDTKLDEKLLSDIEGTISAAVAALREVYLSQDGELHGSKNSDYLVNELHKEADSVQAFMAECTRRLEGKQIKKTVLFEEYCKYCQDSERVAYKKQSFYRSIAEKGLALKKTMGEWYYDGLVLIEEESNFEPISKQEKIPFDV